MSDVAIKVQNLSKLYQIGSHKSGSLKETLVHTFKSLAGNKKSQTTEDFWALQDINFEIRQGEAVGIIGKNGAGKSTLLKILSRITEPTTGRIEINGRVSSLLEVGTGFHPELSGRENIFLNGTILGMSRREIKAKFDEIIDFSGVEKFIDTPVKHYSSGMYVRLAFAVAAHLEPEILIIDEVLAVGDAEFQKKCLGKMSEVAGKGRTVLFVSHNMTAVEALCTSCVYLKAGQIFFTGNVSETVEKYLNTENKNVARQVFNPPIGDETVKLRSCQLVNEAGSVSNFFDMKESISIKINYQIFQEGFLPLPNIHIYTIQNECVFASVSETDKLSAIPGIHECTVRIPAHLLNDGVYLVRIACTTMQSVTIHFDLPEVLTFEVRENLNERANDFRGKMPGLIRPELFWTHSLETTYSIQS